MERKYQSEALLALNRVADYKVSISPYRSLNTWRGVISGDDLLDTPEKEILDRLHDQSVVDAKRITLRRYGEEKGTKHVILLFDTTMPPGSALYLLKGN